jgi:ribose-phosphate pyrophosphokinase
LHKRRISGDETAVTQIVGDVEDRPCLIIDDIISTGGTIAESIEALLDAGAREEFFIAATHGLLLPGSREKLDRAAVQSVLVTDTVQVLQRDWPKLQIVSIAPLIAAALKRLLGDGSMADLYRDEAPSGWAHEEHKT